MLISRTIIFIKLATAILTLLIFIPDAIAIFKYERKVYIANKQIEFKNNKLTAKTNALKAKLHNLYTQEKIAISLLTPSYNQDFLGYTKLWISSLQQRYALKNTSIEIKNPPFTLKSKYEFHALKETQLQLQFEVIDELQTAMLLDELIEKFPGYVMVNSLEISKIAEGKTYTTINFSTYLLEELEITSLKQSLS